MQVHTFIADSAPEAVTRIREELGPAAVVLQVRRVGGEGIARLWSRSRIEVLACLPAVEPVQKPARDSAVEELRDEVRQLRERIVHRPDPPIHAPAPSIVAPEPSFPAANAPGPIPEGAWRVQSLLERTGVLPVLVQRAMDNLRGRHGDRPPAGLAQEIELARGYFSALWPVAKVRAGVRRHVFVGPSGVGKTTVLCKWLARHILQENGRARVLTMDAHGANLSGLLSMYGEILGVPVERELGGEPSQDPEEVVFVDVAGCSHGDSAALAALGTAVRALGEVEVHLVLNAAYETGHLMAAARGFAALPVRDIILTHCDEEPRWGKIWNLVLGTNFPVRFLSAGQNVPGDFVPAAPGMILDRQFSQ